MIASSSPCRRLELGTSTSLSVAAIYDDKGKLNSSRYDTSYCCTARVILSTLLVYTDCHSVSEARTFPPAPRQSLDSLLLDRSRLHCNKTCLIRIPCHPMQGTSRSHAASTRFARSCPTRRASYTPSPATPMCAVTRFQGSKNLKYAAKLPVGKGKKPKGHIRKTTG